MDVKYIKLMGRGEIVQLRLEMLREEAGKAGYCDWQVERLADCLRKELETRDDDLRNYPEAETDFARISLAVHPGIDDRAMFEEALEWGAKCTR